MTAPDPTDSNNWIYEILQDQTEELTDAVLQSLADGQFTTDEPERGADVRSVTVTIPVTLQLYSDVVAYYLDQTEQ